MPNHTTWVIVANGALAKVYRVVRFPQVEEIADLAHPQSRLRNRDLVSSGPGRVSESTGPSRSAYQAKSDPHQLEIESFAKVVGDFLSTSYQNGEFTRLYVFAAPGFLGMLRPHLDSKSKDCIIAEVAKDLTEHTKFEIEKHLSEA